MISVHEAYMYAGCGHVIYDYTNHDTVLRVSLTNTTRVELERRNCTPHRLVSQITHNCRATFMSRFLSKDRVLIFNLNIRLCMLN